MSDIHPSVRGARVFVGLSGGVDSAVTAALLKRAGAAVTGVFIKGWYPPGMPCTWSTDRRDAMRVAARLAIPFMTLDASDEYKRSVIDYLLAEYRAGRTPNPDIMCNREVKFGAFYRYAMEHAADFIATGHYARQKDGALLRGLDEAKDQSYFLWAVPREVLGTTLFPLGGMHKTEVRALARSFALPVASKRDSQGICFLGNVSVEDFLRAEIGATPGRALDESGAIIGQHDGALLATFGQRVSLQGAPAGPWYVLAKDVEKNELVVGHRQRTAIARQDCALTSTNWLSALSDGEALTAQYRYHGPRIVGTLTDENSTFIPGTELTEPIAPGQSLVLYRGDQCIGGGILA